MRYQRATIVRAILANLGFLFQMSGYFLLPSIAYAYYLGQDQPMTALLLTALVFFFLGFPLNALGERKALNIRQSATLLVLFYVLVPLVNTIPYIYLRSFEGDLLSQMLNIFFETVSSSTTTGVTLLKDVYELPRPLLLA